MAGREAEPIEVPVYAVYSRSDGVVAWRACIDRYQSALVEHFEVSSSHLGLIGSSEVFKLIAELLARPRAAAQSPPADAAKNATARSTGPSAISEPDPPPPAHSSDSRRP